MKCRLSALLALAGVLCPLPSAAQTQYVRGAPATTPIADQHPVVRGEPVYDTDPATGIYDRLTDLNDVDAGGRQRFDFYDNYARAADPRTSLNNGGWYCSPTAALTLIHYWDVWDGNLDGQPDYPLLIRDGTPDRDVILELANLMDTDDVVDRGAADAAEFHLGTRFVDIRPALAAYCDARYPHRFFSGAFRAAGVGDAGFGLLYDALIDREIPVVLSFPGHSTAGIGYNRGVRAPDPGHYQVSDPWDARADIRGNLVGLGRPLGLHDVAGSSLVSLQYGSEFEVYDNSSQTYGPLHMAWVAPSEIPEPGGAALLVSAVSALGVWRRARRTRS